jgi:hypothetical protein
MIKQRAYDIRTMPRENFINPAHYDEMIGYYGRLKGATPFLCQNFIATTREAIKPEFRPFSSVRHDQMIGVDEPLHPYLAGPPVPLSSLPAKQKRLDPKSHTSLPNNSPQRYVDPNIETNVQSTFPPSSSTSLQANSTHVHSMFDWFVHTLQPDDFKDPRTYDVVQGFKNAGEFAGLQLEGKRSFLLDWMKYVKTDKQRKVPIDVYDQYVGVNEEPLEYNAAANMRTTQQLNKKLVYAADPDTTPMYSPERHVDPNEEYDKLVNEASDYRRSQRCPEQTTSDVEVLSTR